MVALNFKNDVPPLPPFFYDENPKWPQKPDMDIALLLFFYGRYVKNSFSQHGIFIPRKLEFMFFCHPGGSLREPFGSFLSKKRAILGQISIQIEICQPFKTCFSPIGLQNIVDIQTKGFIRIKIFKRSIQQLQNLPFLTKKDSFS